MIASQPNNSFPCCCGLFGNRSQTDDIKCGSCKKVAQEAQLSVSLMFLLHFDVFWDLELNKHMSTWNLFVNYIINKGRMFRSSMCLPCKRLLIGTNQNMWGKANNSVYYDYDEIIIMLHGCSMGYIFTDVSSFDRACEWFKINCFKYMCNSPR